MIYKAAASSHSFLCLGGTPRSVGFIPSFLLLELVSGALWEINHLAYSHFT